MSSTLFKAVASVSLAIAAAPSPASALRLKVATYGGSYYTPDNRRSDDAALRAAH